MRTARLGQVWHAFGDCVSSGKQCGASDDPHVALLMGVKFMLEFNAKTILVCPDDPAFALGALAFPSVWHLHGYDLSDG